MDGLYRILGFFGLFGPIIESKNGLGEARNGQNPHLAVLENRKTDFRPTCVMVFLVRYAGSVGDYGRVYRVSGFFGLVWPIIESNKGLREARNGQNPHFAVLACIYGQSRLLVPSEASLGLQAPYVFCLYGWRSERSDRSERSKRSERSERSPLRHPKGLMPYANTPKGGGDRYIYIYMCVCMCIG